MLHNLAKQLKWQKEKKSNCILTSRLVHDVMISLRGLIWAANSCAWDTFLTVFIQLYYSYILPNNEVKTACYSQVTLLQHLEKCLPIIESMFDPFAFKREFVSVILAPARFEINENTCIGYIEELCFPSGGRFWGCQRQYRNICGKCCAEVQVLGSDEGINIDFHIITISSEIYNVTDAIKYYERGYYVNADGLVQADYLKECGVCKKCNTAEIKPLYEPKVITFSMDAYTASKRIHMTELTSIDRNVTLFGVRYRLFAIMYCVNGNHFAGRIIRNVGGKLVFLEYDGMKDFGIIQVKECKSKLDIEKFCSWHWTEERKTRYGISDIVLGIVSNLVYVRELDEL